jgi:hypothetical protein
MSLDRSADQPHDIMVWQGRRPETGDDLEPIPQNQPVDSYARRGRFRSTGIFRLSYTDGCEFHVDANGREIWANWSFPMTAEDMATYLLGPIIGFAFRLRGALALHASSVLIDNVAITLMGPTGAGKSTTAAAFALNGFPVLADDVSVLDQIDGFHFVRPAYPHLRLWPKSVELLYGETTALKPITPSWDKRDLPLADIHRFHNRPARLAVIYMLDWGTNDAETRTIEPLQGNLRLMALVANTYGNNLLDKQTRAAEFKALAPLAERVPMRRLPLSNNDRQLDVLCSSVAADVRQLAFSHGHWPWYGKPPADG